MTSFTLKLIALFTMLCDHIGYGLIGHTSFFNLIGRIAFPIFAFQISEGFKHTKNIKQYTLRLLLFAIISQIPFYLYTYKFNLSFHNLNIFFTLLLGLSCIAIYDYLSNIDNIFKYKINKFLAFFIIIMVACIAQLINVDYGFWGVIVIFSFYLFKNDKLAMSIAFVTLCIIRYGIWCIMYGFNIFYVMLALFTALPIIFIVMYNGKQGKKIKYLLYCFYPLHLLLLYLIF